VIRHFLRAGAYGAPAWFEQYASYVPCRWLCAYEPLARPLLADSIFRAVSEVQRPWCSVSDGSLVDRQEMPYPKGLMHIEWYWAIWPKSPVPQLTSRGSQVRNLHRPQWNKALTRFGDFASIVCCRFRCQLRKHFRMAAPFPHDGSPYCAHSVRAFL